MYYSRYSFICRGYFFNSWILAKKGKDKKIGTSGKKGRLARTFFVKCRIFSVMNVVRKPPYIRRWIERFDNGDEDLNDDPSPGRPQKHAVISRGF